MSKSTISYQEVSDIAESITKLGNHPTVKVVRETLGRGSDTTINNLLSRWKRAQNNSGFNQDDSLLEAVKLLKERANDDASKRIAEMTEQHQKVVNEYLSTIGQLTSEITSLSNKSEFLTVNGREKDNIILNLEIECEDLNNKLNDMTNTALIKSNIVMEKELMIEKLDEQLRMNQRNIEHFWESTKQSRDNEKNAHESIAFNIRKENAEIVKMQEQEISRLLIRIECLERLDKTYIFENAKVQAEIEKLNYIVNNQDMVISDKDETLSAFKKIIRDQEIKNKDLKQDNLFLIQERNGVFREDK